MVIKLDDFFASDIAGVLDGDGDFAFAGGLVEFVGGNPFFESGVGFAFAEGIHDLIFVIEGRISHSAGDVITVADVDALTIFDELLAAVLVGEGAVVTHGLEGWCALGVLGPGVAQFTRWDIFAFEDFGDGAVAG